VRIDRPGVSFGAIWRSAVPGVEAIPDESGVGIG
jgi:hypothetical protein